MLSFQYFSKFFIVPNRWKLEIQHHSGTENEWRLFAAVDESLLLCFQLCESMCGTNTKQLVSIFLVANDHVTLHWINKNFLHHFLTSMEFCQSCPVMVSLPSVVLVCWWLEELSFSTQAIYMLCIQIFLFYPLCGTTEVPWKPRQLWHHFPLENASQTFCREDAWPVHWVSCARGEPSSLRVSSNTWCASKYDEWLSVSEHSGPTSMNMCWCEFNSRSAVC